MAKPRKQKKPLEAVDGPYAAWPHAVADSMAYLGASYAARCLLMEAMRQLNGINNGHLQLTYSWLKKRGWNSRDVIQRAKNELLERGLLVQTRQGGRNIGPSLYAVTWLPITNFFGLDIYPKEYRRGAWALMDSTPLRRKIAIPVPHSGSGCTGKRDRANP